MDNPSDFSSSIVRDVTVDSAYSEMSSASSSSASSPSSSASSSSASSPSSSAFSPSSSAFSPSSSASSPSSSDSSRSFSDSSPSSSADSVTSSATSSPSSSSVITSTSSVPSSSSTTSDISAATNGENCVGVISTSTAASSTTTMRSSTTAQLISSSDGNIDNISSSSSLLHSLNEKSSGSRASVSQEEVASPNTSSGRTDRDNNSKIVSEEESRLDELRRFVGPLSKEQLINILASAAFTHQDVFDSCTTSVEASPASRRLMIRNVSFSSRDESFVNLFGSFGVVEDAVVVRDKDGRSKGYGFVTYKEMKGAKLCLSRGPLMLDGKEMIVKLAADSFTDAERQRKLFIRNLAEGTEAATLKGVFGDYGTLEECVVVKDSKGKSKGYAFLTFSKASEAFQAVQQSERVIDGRLAFINFAAPVSYKGFHGRMGGGGRGRGGGAEREEKSGGNGGGMYNQGRGRPQRCHHHINRGGGGGMLNGRMVSYYWGGGGNHGVGGNNYIRGSNGDRSPPSMLMGAPTGDAVAEANAAAAAVQAAAAAFSASSAAGYPYIHFIDPRLFGQSFPFNYPGGIPTGYEVYPQSGGGDIMGGGGGQPSETGGGGGRY